MPIPDSVPTLGTQPIPGDLPAGASARYDELFARLEAEMLKLENPAGGDVAWKQAVADATTLLGEKSKDLLVAAYLTRGLHQLHGLEGLAGGLGVMRGICTTFWEGCHPQRPRARRAALEWISERAAAMITPASIQPQEQGAVAAALAVVDDMWTTLGDRFDGEDCGLATVRRQLKDATAAAQGSAGDTPMEARSTGSSIQDHVSAGPSAAAGGPVTTRQAAVSRLSEVAAYYQRYEPHSPVGYLVNRAMQWSGKSFEDVFHELLKDKREAQEHLWNTLGIAMPKDPV